ncbi:MAG: BMP family ABC transporter substrate-binding protein [Acidimicrobiales bacterium]|jgi:basic membrane protein A
MNSIGRGRLGRVALAASTACLLFTGLTIVAAGSAGAATYKKTLACEVTDTGGINDRSFNASAYLGLEQAKKVDPSEIKTEVQSTPSNGTESTYETEISSFVSQHCSIIITVGFLMSDATWNAAHQNPADHFAQVDNSNSSPGKDGVALPPYKGTAKNILGLTYETQQDAFLGGYEAAAYAVAHNPTAPKVGTYGGEQFSSVTYYMDGYYDGVQYYNTKMKPKVPVAVLGWNEKTQKGTFIGSFTDQTTAASDTTAQLSQGATTIFPVAGSDGLGTTAAVKTWNASHSLKANVEWVDTDGCVNDPADCNLFLSSVTKGVTASVKAAVLEQAEGKFTGGDYIGTLKNGGAAFIEDHGTAGKANSAATLAAIATLSTDIENGTITIPVGGK